MTSEENRMNFVDSSFITAAGWFTDDSDTGWLRVRYKNDGSEVEYQIPRSEYDLMMADPRPGQYFRRNIYRAGHNWRRV